MRTLSARPVAIAAIMSLSVLLYSMAGGRTASAADPFAAGGTGQPAIAAAGTPAATSKRPVLDCPIGIAVNSADELFVANHYQFNTFCGTPGQILVFDKNGNQLPSRTITAGLTNPAAIAFDKGGNIYVTDFNKQEVLVYDPKGKPIPSKTLHTETSPYNPSGVQIDSSGDVWVNNRNNSNFSVGELEIFRKRHSVPDKIFMGLAYPVGIAFQPKTGKAYIGNATTVSNSFAVFTRSGHFLGNISTGSFTPTYLAFAKNGNFYATDGIVGVNEAAMFSSIGGIIGSPFTAGLNQPYGIAVNKAGDFYVANIGNNTPLAPSFISKFSSSGKLICTIVQTGCH
jgi:DNA-binding beta-propeller fold protein YncE